MDRKYLMVAAYLREQIRKQLLRPGDRVPSENDLAKTFTVSRLTVTRAMDLLKQENLIYSVQGSGTFVRIPRRPESVVHVPSGMPVQVRTMLEATLASAWEDYEGNRLDPEAFWNFLTSVGR